ncbi:MAG: co-chaperone GroES [Halanaerobiales bacterium]|nr:co-chaperone GroES [Halanaerobiales bacterium]
MSVKPLGDRVAVKLVEREEKTEGGIVIPDTAKKEKPQTGEVFEVGRGCYEDEEPEIAKGDMVVFDKFAGTEVTVDGTEFKIVNVEDIVAVIG